MGAYSYLLRGESNWVRSHGRSKLHLGQCLPLFGAVVWIAATGLAFEDGYYAARAVVLGAVRLSYLGNRHGLCTQLVVRLAVHGEPITT